MKDTVLRTAAGEQPVRSFMGCDAHRKYSVFVSLDEHGKMSSPVRVEHDLKDVRMFLRHLEPGTDVAVKATGSWYWLVDENEAAGLAPQPFAAKRMLGPGAKKTDVVDARALSILLRNGTLPETWIPTSETRDRTHILRAYFESLEFLSAVGVCGSGQLRGGVSQAISSAAC